MGNSVDLSKYSVRTDLAIDSLYKNKGNYDNSNTRVIDGVKVTSLVVDDDISLRIGKKIGNYITIEFDDITDFDNKEKVKKVFSLELKNFLNTHNIKSDASCLVVGLGNNKSTPDALGSISVDNLIVTNHLYSLNLLDQGFRRVYAIKSGVLGETGIESSVITSSIVSSVKPDFVIVIDALASSSIERVNSTIQLTDAGILPGSGVGNSRCEISSDTLGVPVIAVGATTTVDAVTIVSDTIDYMFKHFSYVKDNIDNPMNKLIVGGEVDYRNKAHDLSENDKHEIFGMIGDMDKNSVRKLVSEVLSPIGYNFMVTPKEIDFLVDRLGDVIGNGINKALHEKVDNL